MIAPVLGKFRDELHGLFRIVVGFLFLSHGAGKLFGIMGREEPVELLSAFGVAGVLEFFGGILVMLGVFTSPVAFILAGEMAVAYFWRHVPRGSLWPWANGGELPALYCFSFLSLAAAGGGRFALDSVLPWRKSPEQGA